MSTEVDGIEGWDGPTPIGHTANGRFRWAPSWVVDWPEAERVRLLAFLKEHPGALVDTDQSSKEGSWLLGFFRDGGEVLNPYTKEEGRALLMAAANPTEWGT